MQANVILNEPPPLSYAPESFSYRLMALFYSLFSATEDYYFRRPAPLSTSYGSPYSKPRADSFCSLPECPWNRFILVASFSDDSSICSTFITGMTSVHFKYYIYIYVSLV